jgi:hypothetical protein
MSKIKLTKEQYSKLRQNLVESALIMEQTNDEVRDIQKSLNKCFNAGLSEDGICGNNTKNAIEKHLGIRTFKI